MFEAGYTRDLIKLGYHDAMEARIAAHGVHEREKVPAVPVMAASGVAKAATPGGVQAT